MTTPVGGAATRGTAARFGHRATIVISRFLWRALIAAITLGRGGTAMIESYSVILTETPPGCVTFDPTA
jgi:hypothetical protein